MELISRGRDISYVEKSVTFYHDSNRGKITIWSLQLSIWHIKKCQFCSYKVKFNKQLILQRKILSEYKVLQGASKKLFKCGSFQQQIFKDFSSFSKEIICFFIDNCPRLVIHFALTNERTKKSNCCEYQYCISKWAVNSFDRRRLI